MGAPIAARLAAPAVGAGLDVTAFDTDPERRGDAAARGVAIARSAEDVATVADVLVTVLPGAAELRAALLPGDDGPGLLSRLRPGALLLDLTSGDPALTAELVHAAAAGGASVVSAPMAGGPEDAEAATLRFYRAGRTADAGRADSVLRPLAAEGGILPVGDDPAAAQAVKLLVNAVWFGQAALVAETMAAGAASGLDPALLQRLLAGSAAGSRFVDEYVPRLLRGDYAETFGIDRVVEELDAVVALTRREATPADILTRVRDLHADALARYGPVPGELLAMRLVEDRAGRPLRPGVTGRGDSDGGSRGGLEVVGDEVVGDREG